MTTLEVNMCRLQSSESANAYAHRPQQQPAPQHHLSKSQALPGSAVSRECVKNLTFAISWPGLKNGRASGLLSKGTFPRQGGVRTREVKCIGVPLCDASRFYIPEDAETYLYNGEPYIGGCMKLFSRPDALKRHLDNCSLGCVSSREITSDSEHH
ncbi:hypothetical protein CPB84DRAFT_1766570 [Gymnopilus junonius]|uniref:Uncharacterized protein n=1 Tax=Gymnopilus junonius TaxID=109634 RepID=A0A9P5TT65_GYMJU|nr:hypothetical protein CPB84DRAFT_1766570 [Gymnopilus junonius]